MTETAVAPTELVEQVRKIMTDRWPDLMNIGWLPPSKYAPLGAIWMTPDPREFIRSLAIIPQGTLHEQLSYCTTVTGDFWAAWYAITPSVRRAILEASIPALADLAKSLSKPSRWDIH